MEVEQLFPGVFEMRTSYGRDSAGLLSNGRPLPHALWFVSGPTPAILDPGPTVVVQEALQVIRGLGYDPADIEYAVPSHIHVDHGGAAGWMVRELPKVKVVIHQRGARFMLDPSRLREGTASVFGADWEEMFGPLLPVPQERLVAAEDGYTIPIGGRPHRIVYLPGHSLDHIGVYDEGLKALYCGHALGQYLPGRVLPDPPATLPYFDVEATLSSLARVRELAPSYLFLAHSGLLAANPSWAVDTTGWVTRELEKIVSTGVEAGSAPESIEKQVRAFLFAMPSKADHTYQALVQSYITYFQRRQSRR